MSKKEVLYNDTPPTKIRNIKEKFRPANETPFWLRIGDAFFFNMMHHRFYALRVKDAHNFEKRNKDYSTIFYASHTNWWDGATGYNLCRRVFNVRMRIMVEELNRFPILCRAGAFSVNKQSAQTAMESLKYSVDILKDPEMSLWIFPQGIIKPPDYRPIEFESGLAYIAKKLGRVNLIPVSTRFTFLRENRPEALVEVGEPIFFDNWDMSRQELSDMLALQYTKMQDAQASKISNGDVEGYEYVFREKLPWYKKLEKHLKRV